MATTPSTPPAQPARVQARIQPPPRRGFFNMLFLGPGGKWSTVARAAAHGVTATISRQKVTTKKGSVFVYRIGFWKSYKDANGRWRHAHALYRTELLEAIVQLQQAVQTLPEE